MTTTRLLYAQAALLAATLACDRECQAPLDDPGNQTPAELETCPELPPGVEPIAGLRVAHAVDRFGGLTLTLSTRPLACGETAAQHDYCPSDEDLGISVGFPAREAVVGEFPLRHPLHLEYETPTRLSVGGGLPEASIEIFAITDTCVTGRIVGVEAENGPFDGGFRAPRCTP